MKKSTFVLAILAVACGAASAADLTKLAPVKAFYADASHCMYMVDNPAEVADSVSQKYAKASEAAIAAMQKADPSLSLDKALLALRKGCNGTLQAAAK